MLNVVNLVNNNWTRLITNGLNGERNLNCEKLHVGMELFSNEYVPLILSNEGLSIVTPATVIAFVLLNVPCKQGQKSGGLGAAQQHLDGEYLVSIYGVIQ